jgi:hypothetical protein
MTTRIYDKTDKGREEIATRKYQLAPKLRTLLVMIDGRHALGSLLKNFAALGLREENLEDLLRQEYIMLVSGGPAAIEPEAAAKRPPASARARMLARTAARQGRLANPDLDGPASQAQAEPADKPGGKPEIGDSKPPGEAAPAARGAFDYFNLASESVNF